MLDGRSISDGLQKANCIKNNGDLEKQICKKCIVYVSKNNNFNNLSNVNEAC